MTHDLAIIEREDLGDLDKSIYVARHISSAMDILRPLVYSVWKDELWKGRFGSFGEYVESPEGLGRSQGYASKLKTVEEFRLQGGLSEKDLAGIDYESVYLAIKAGGTPEEIVAKAKTLTRAELRAERIDAKDHEHDWITACAECWVKKDATEPF